MVLQNNHVQFSMAPLTCVTIRSKQFVFFFFFTKTFAKILSQKKFLFCWNLEQETSRGHSLNDRFCNWQRLLFFFKFINMLLIKIEQKFFLKMLALSFFLFFAVFACCVT